MKTALLSFLLSFSAFASDCYVRQVEIENNKVSLSGEICINNIDLKLEAFGNSQATLKYTLDGVAKEKVIKLNNPIDRRDGSVVFFAWGLESDYEGGMCGDTTEASIDATLVMNKDGSNARLEEIKGSISYSYDNCHSSSREIQGFEYLKI